MPELQERRGGTLAETMKQALSKARKRYQIDPYKH